MRITLPIAVKKGDNANLICNYDMEGDTLYSVKYYKGRREFYRYTPKEIPAIKVFPHPGIRIEVSAMCDCTEMDSFAPWQEEWLSYLFIQRKMVKEECPGTSMGMDTGKLFSTNSIPWYILFTTWTW